MLKIDPRIVSDTWIPLPPIAEQKCIVTKFVFCCTSVSKDRAVLTDGFQAFLIMVVTGIYAVLVQNIALSADVSGAIWGCMGYTVPLCFCLFKTGSIAKAIFASH